ncbi:MAG: hypothetical protein QXI19_04070 [Candidatus Caldarchaeum sp.]
MPRGRPRKSEALENDPLRAKETYIDADGRRREKGTDLLVDSEGYIILNQRRPTKRSYTSPGVINKKRRIRRRIEEIRVLLSLSMSNKDIVDLIISYGESDKLKDNIWVGPTGKPLSRSYITTLISYARKRQQVLANRRPEEAFADSLNFWSRKLQETHQRKVRGTREYEAAQRLLDGVDALMKQAVESQDEEQIRSVGEILKLANRRLENARRTIISADRQLESIQDRIDKLCGNYAADKLALIKPDMKITEPLNREEAMKLLVSSLKEAFPTLTDEQLKTLGIPVNNQPQLLGVDIPYEVVREE